MFFIVLQTFAAGCRCVLHVSWSRGANHEEVDPSHDGGVTPLCDTRHVPVNHKRLLKRLELLCCQYRHTFFARLYTQ